MHLGLSDIMGDLLLLEEEKIVFFIILFPHHLSKQIIQNNITAKPFL